MLAVAARNIADAVIIGVSTDARVGFAHAVVLAVAASALAAEGYRAGKDRHHERLLDSLQYSIGIETTLLKQLHAVRRARNAMTYERLGDTTPAEADGIVARAREVYGLVIKWIRSNHPALLT